MKPRKLTLSEMSALAQAREDVLATAQLYAEPHTDLTQLFDDEIMDLVEAGDQLNDPLYKRWIARSEKLAAEQGIDLAGIRQGAAAQLRAALGFPSGQEALGKTQLQDPLGEDQGKPNRQHQQKAANKTEHSESAQA